MNLKTIEKLADMTGYTTAAIRCKITRGDWKLGREYVKAPDGRILIILEAFEAWATGNIQGSEKPATPQLKSISTIETSAAGNVSHLSPPPLI